MAHMTVFSCIYQASVFQRIQAYLYLEVKKNEIGDGI